MSKIMSLKDVKKLHQKKYRDEYGAFTVEGIKGVEEALQSSWNVRALVVDKAQLSKDALDTLLTRARDNNISIIECTPRQARQISATETFSGILAVVERPARSVSDVADGASVIVLDRVNDPGNLGTIIRTAHWFGISTIMLSEGCADPYSPKAVRSTMGSLFNVRLIETKDIVANVTACKERGFRICGFSTRGKDIHTLKAPAKGMYIFGSESHGIRPELESLVHDFYCISGGGGAESLNLAVATGIIFFYLSSRT